MTKNFAIIEHFEDRFQNLKNSKKVIGDKCEYPNQTVTNIINLFNNLFKDNKVEISHNAFQSPIYNIWSTLNFIKYNKKPLLITGGKGITLDFALASGYAELMERFEIGYSFSKNPYKPILLPQHKKNISQKELEFHKSFQECLEQNNPYLPNWKGYQKILVPCINIDTMDTVFIDNRFLFGGTGCVAGNTYEEALVQGLCEIFERYTAGFTLLNKIKCPSIPLDNLAPYIQENIFLLKRLGIDVIIKDLSLNKSIPSVGLLFCYENLGVKEFRAGSATTLNIAVERCLTETMQIWALSVLKKKIISPKISKIIEGHVNRIEKHILKARMLYKTFPSLEEYLPYRYFITMGFPRHGFFPSDELEFLTLNCGKVKYWNYCNADCYYEAIFLKNLCYKNSWRIFIHDYNWLGFPAIKIFVPELAFGFQDFKLYQSKEVNEINKKIISDLRSISTDDLRVINSPEFLIYAAFNNTLSRYLRIETNTLQNISVWEFFGLLALAIGNGNLSRNYLKQLFDLNYLRKNLILIKNKEKIIPYLQNLIPNCLDTCNKCKFKKECKYMILKEFEKKIHQNFPNTFTLEKINERFPHL